VSDSYGGALNDPMTQAIIQMLLQGGGGLAQQQPAWQGAAAPDLLSQLSFGYDPSMMQQSSLAGFIPPSQDEEDAGSLEEAGRQGNYLQDFLDLTADPVAAAMFGAGGFSQDSFAPTVTRELIPRPNTDRFNQWLTQPDSWEGMIASRVQGGRSPRSAIIELREVMENADADAKANGDNADQQLQQQAAAIRRMLPPAYQSGDSLEPLTGAAAIDWQQAFSDADDLMKPYLEEQETQPGPVGEQRNEFGDIVSSGGEIVVGPDGQLYRETTEESPLAEKYRELGIPLPTETYDAGDLLGAQWQQAEESYLNEVPELDDAYSRLMEDYQRGMQASTGANLSQGDVFAMDQQAAMGRGAGSRTPTGGGTVPKAQPQQEQQGSWWDRQAGGSDNSAAGRLQAVGETAGPPTAAVGRWFQDLFSSAGQQAGPQTTISGTDTYGFPTTSATGGSGLEGIIQSIPADVGQAGLTDLNVLAGPNSVTAQGLDTWGGGLAAGASNVGHADPLGAISNATGSWWNAIKGYLQNGQDVDPAAAAQINPQTGLDAGGFQPPPPRNAEDLIPGSTQWLLSQTLGNQGNPNAAGHRQAPPTPGTPLPALTTADLAAIFDDGNAVPGIGGGGAGGQGAPRTAADLAGVPSAAPGPQPLPAAPGGQYTPAPGNYWRDGAWYDGQDRLLGYAISPGDPPGSGSATPRRGDSQSQQTWFPEGAPGSPQTGPPEAQMSASQIYDQQHRQARPPTDANTLAILRQMLTPTQIFENQRQEQFADPHRSSTRTGPEPSEGVKRSRPSSERTGPEPSEQTTPLLELVWPGGRQRQTPGPQATQEMLRMLFPGSESRPRSMATSRAKPSPGPRSGKQNLYFDTHRAGPVDTYKLTQRGTAQRSRRQANATRNRVNSDSQAVYGEDYWRARGYAEALQRMGVTPTSVALANRTGGLNQMFGRK
jgi:hypothetical protein